MATTAKPYSELTDQIQRQLDSIIEMAIQVDRAGVTQVPLRSHWTDAGRSWTGLAALQRRLSPTTLSAETADDTFILSAEWK